MLVSLSNSWHNVNECMCTLYAKLKSVLGGWGRVRLCLSTPTLLYMTLLIPHYVYLLLIHSEKHPAPPKNRLGGGVWEYFLMRISTFEPSWCMLPEENAGLKFFSELKRSKDTSCNEQSIYGYSIQACMWLMLTSLLSPATLQLDHGKVGLQ